MSIFHKTIVAVEVKDDSPETRERLTSQLCMEDPVFVYNDTTGALELMLQRKEDGSIRTVPLGKWLFRNDEGEFGFLSYDELVEQYGQPIEGTEDFGTAKSRKLFVSCPMKGRSEEVVYREFDRLCRVAEAYFDETFDIIESFFEEEPPEGITGDKAAVWYLGKSISKISEADVAIFAEGWYDARGCRVEHDVCRSYGIPVIEVELHKARRPEPVECES